MNREVQVRICERLGVKSPGLLGKGGCGRQADGTADLPPAPEIPVHSGTYVSRQNQTFWLI
jgi:hypothetical protein